MAIESRSTSGNSSGPIPERPSAMAAIVSLAVRPRAFTAPCPVMTTRRATYFAAATSDSTASTIVPTVLMSNSERPGSLAL